MANKQEVKVSLSAIHEKATSDIKKYIKSAINEKIVESQNEITQRNTTISGKYNKIVQEIANAETKEIAEVKMKYDSLRRQAERDRDIAYATVKKEAEERAKESFDEFASYITALASAGKTLSDITFDE